MELNTPIRIVDALGGDCFWIEDADGETVADDGSAFGEYVQKMTRDGARRFVACVNACKGIKTDYLETLIRESSSINHEIMQRIQNKNAADIACKKAEQQRDQLLVALKDILYNLTIEGLRGNTGIMDIGVTGDEVRAGLEAIAAVEQPAAAPDAVGWIEWKGGECPAKWNESVEVRFKCGGVSSYSHAGNVRWLHWGDHGDIVAYRVVQGGAA